MYYMEKVICGVLHYKTTPLGKWKPFSLERLTKRLIEAEERLTQSGR